jgi:hypothetical protein
VLLAFGTPTVLSPGERVYRARINPTDVWQPLEHDSPPEQIPGRLNSNGACVFYGSRDVETCLFEIRPSVFDLVENRIFLATFSPTKELKVLDFHNINEETAREVSGTDHWEHEALFYFLRRRLFAPKYDDYDITQDLGHYIKSLGYEGLVYTAAMSYFRNGEWTENIAFLVHPCATEG